MSPITHALDRRAPARTVIAPELIAGDDHPLELVRELHAAWFERLESWVDDGLVVVFDEVIVGALDPFLLEVLHLARLARSTVELDPYDEFGERWAADDSDEVSRSLAADVRELLIGRDRERCVDPAELLRPPLVGSQPDQLVPAIVMLANLERWLAAAASRVRVGRGAVVALWPGRWDC